MKKEIIYPVKSLETKQKQYIKYLKWVIDTYGPDQHVTSTNCNNNCNNNRDDYCIDYGRVCGAVWVNKYH